MLPEKDKRVPLNILKKTQYNTIRLSATKILYASVERWLYPDFHL
jgi:hypothetical protein